METSREPGKTGCGRFIGIRNTSGMVATGYKRVSKKRPCDICGKPDWCSTTAEETISFCARSTLNADRISRYGWGVYYRDRHRYVFDFKRNPKLPTKQKKSRSSQTLAPPSIRDRVYRKLIEISPAFSSSEIVNGRGGLSERGIIDISQYGSLPRLVNERQELVERLVDSMEKDRIRSFEGIPGFWKDAKETLRLWSDSDSFDDLMVIPFIGPDGLIRACQIRFMRYIPNKSGRYAWLSSAKQNNGCGSGAPLHHASPGQRFDKPVLVTEGALKAATAQRFLTDRYVVGNSGVATSHTEIVNTARRKPLEIAFDNDSFTNPHVARALAALLRLRYSDQKSYSYNEKVRIVTWEKPVKGLDDALLAGASLKYLTVSEWLKYLTPECVEQANRQLSLSLGRGKSGWQKV